MNVSEEALQRCPTYKIGTPNTEHIVVPAEMLAVPEITDSQKLGELVTSMRASGWVGDPVVALRMTQAHWLVLSGVYRIHAARIAGIPVPLLSISYPVSGVDLDLSNQGLWGNFVTSDTDDQLADAAGVLVGRHDLDPEVFRVLEIERDKHAEQRANGRGQDKVLNNVGPLRGTGDYLDV